MRRVIYDKLEGHMRLVIYDKMRDSSDETHETSYI